MLEDIKLLHDKQKHTQRQEYVKRVNLDVKNLLATRMTVTILINWLYELKCIQF